MLYNLFKNKGFEFYGLITKTRRNKRSGAKYVVGEHVTWNATKIQQLVKGKLREDCEKPTQVHAN